MKKLKLSLAALAFIVGIGSAVVTKANTLTDGELKWFSLETGGDKTQESDYSVLPGTPTDCSDGQNVCAIHTMQKPDGSPDLDNIQDYEYRQNP